MILAVGAVLLVHVHLPAAVGSAFANSHWILQGENFVIFLVTLIASTAKGTLNPETNV